MGGSLQLIGHLFYGEFCFFWGCFFRDLLEGACLLRGRAFVERLLNGCSAFVQRVFGQYTFYTCALSVFLDYHFLIFVIPLLLPMFAGCAVVCRVLPCGFVIPPVSLILCGGRYVLEQVLIF